VRAVGAPLGHSGRSGLNINNYNDGHCEKGNRSGREEEDDAAAKVAVKELGLMVMGGFSFKYPMTPSYGPQRGRM
jgi:hypothetical protein